MLWWEAAGRGWILGFLLLMELNYNPWISWLIFFIHTLKIWHPQRLTSSLMSAHCTDRHFWQTLKNKRAFLFRHFSSVWNRKKKTCQALTSTRFVYLYISCHYVNAWTAILLPIFINYSSWWWNFKTQCNKSVFFQFPLPVFLRSESAAADITAVTSRPESVGVWKRTYINRRDANKYIYVKSVNISADSVFCLRVKSKI